MRIQFASVLKWTQSALNALMCERGLSIVDYNQYMGGVDRGDQYRQYYRGHVKSRKSYKYFFWFVFGVCVLNAYILSRYSPKIHPISSYLSFRKQLANELIGKYNCRRRQVISQTLIHHHLVVNTHHTI